MLCGGQWSFLLEWWLAPELVYPQMTHLQVELQKAEVRWIRPAARGADQTPADVETDQLYRKFQGILNKLTPTKFQSLAEQALQLDISTEERLCGCIDKIFTKVGVAGCGRVPSEVRVCPIVCRLWRSLASALRTQTSVKS